MNSASCAVGRAPPAGQDEPSPGQPPLRPLSLQPPRLQPPTLHPSTLQPPTLHPPTLRQLLLVPLLAPLLAVVVLAGLNLRPAVSLRLLIWTTPQLPLGSWLALAVAGGGLLSAGATSAALRSGPAAGWRRVRRPAAAAGVPPEPSPPDAPWAAFSAAPPRPAGQPAPTVAVPYRVLRQGSRHGSAAPASGGPAGATASGASSAASSTGTAASSSVASAADDWQQTAAEEW